MTLIETDLPTPEALWFALAYLEAWVPRTYTVTESQVRTLRERGGWYYLTDRGWRGALPPEVTRAFRMVKAGGHGIGQGSLQHREAQRKARELCRAYLDLLGAPPMPRDDAR